VQPVRLPLALTDLRLAVASQVPQHPDRLRRHEAPLQQTRLQELTQPGGVRDIGLAARHLLDVTRIDKQTVELILEDRPDRLPIDAGRLHRHLRHPVRLRPVAQRQQPAHRGLKLRHFLHTATTPLGHAHARLARRRSIATSAARLGDAR